MRWLAGTGTQVLRGVGGDRGRGQCGDHGRREQRGVERGEASQGFVGSMATGREEEVETTRRRRQIGGVEEAGR